MWARILAVHHPVAVAVHRAGVALRVGIMRARVRAVREPVLVVVMGAEVVLAGLVWIVGTGVLAVQDTVLVIIQIAPVGADFGNHQAMNPAVPITLILLGIGVDVADLGDAVAQHGEVGHHAHLLALVFEHHQRIIAVDGNRAFLVDAEPVGIEGTVLIQTLEQDEPPID